MKVCILSMQRVNNFGSVLQSYSLKKMVEQNGNEVSFIDIELKKDDDLLMENSRLDYSSETDVANNLQKKIQHLDKYCINRLKNKIGAKKQEEIFQDFMVNELRLDSKSNQDLYDWAIIGSDEVFNCLTKSPWGFTSQLFGNIPQAKKVMTYAASCGTTTYEALPSKVIKRIENSFENISHFSVRDENTYKFVNQIIGLEPNLNLDPVLVGNFDKEMAQCNFRPKTNKKYCIVYSYFNRIKDEKEIKEIKKFCKEKNLEIVAIGAPQMWVDKFWVLNPFEVLEAFRLADFVITDTFHGTIFAAKYSPRYSVIIRESNKNKLMDLVDRLDIKKHLLTENNKLDKIYDLEKEKNLENLLEKERTKTIMYLNKIV